MVTLRSNVSVARSAVGGGVAVTVTERVAVPVPPSSSVTVSGTVNVPSAVYVRDVANPGRARPVTECPRIPRHRPVRVRRTRTTQTDRPTGHRRRPDHRRRRLVHRRRRRHRHRTGHRAGRTLVVGHRQRHHVGPVSRVGVRRRSPRTRRPITEVPRVPRHRPVRVRRSRPISPTVRPVTDGVPITAVGGWFTGGGAVTVTERVTEPVAPLSSVTVNVTVKVPSAV